MPRFITCLKKTTPTLRANADKHDPGAYKYVAPIKNLTLGIESQTDVPKPGTTQIPKRDIEPGGGLHVEFKNGVFEMPYPFPKTNEEARAVEAALKKCIPPMTLEQAQRKYHYLVDNESGSLNVDYQFDPADEHWTTVDPQLAEGYIVSDKLGSDEKAEKLEKEAEMSAASAPNITPRRGRPPKKG